MSEPEKGMRTGLAWWPLAVGLLAVDLFTKGLIQAKFVLHESLQVLPVLDIPGGSQRWLFTGFAAVVSVLIIVALRRIPATERLQCAGLMLIVSGALGNAIDRVRFGYVVDFIGVHWKGAWFPAFNVADSCITIGAGLILLDSFITWRRERRVAQGRVQ
jgi:signal peptidase II